VHVLAATEDGLYDIDDGGNATRQLPGAITALSVAPDGTRWLVVGDHDLVRGREPVAHRGEELTSVVATPNDVFVGTVGAHVMRLVDGLLARVESFEDLDGRDTWAQPWGAPGDVRSLAADTDAVYVNVHVGGVLRTRDRGESWVQTIDTEVDVHQVVAPGDGRVLAATGAEGLAVSRDGGATWDFVTAGLHGTYLRAVAAVPGAVVVSASTGPFTHEGAVYRLPQGSERFERCNGGLPARFDGNVDSHWIASRGALVVCAGPDATIYRSDDSGVTWRSFVTGLPRVTSIAVAD
jgi:photosystem II stability/assembly factor-like uncharacterized protein